MKYIIDIPNYDVSRWIAETPLGKKMYIPISVEDGKEYSIATEIYAEEYTEPDRKAVDLQHARDIENVARMNYNEGAKDAWEFVTKCLKMDGNDFYDIFGSCDALYLTNLSYQEAKAKYEAWKEFKDEIRIGDEVIYNSRTRAVVLEPETEKKYGEIFTSEGSTIVVSHDDLEKTGRHFDEVEEMLNKMKEQ